MAQTVNFFRFSARRPRLNLGQSSGVCITQVLVCLFALLFDPFNYNSTNALCSFNCHLEDGQWTYQSRSSVRRRPTKAHYSNKIADSVLSDAVHRIRQGLTWISVYHKVQRYTLVFKQFNARYKNVTVPLPIWAKPVNNQQQYLQITFAHFSQSGQQMREGRVQNSLKPANKVGCSQICGAGSSVGIATGYGLESPGIESRWRRDFPHLPRPALESTQPPVQWVPGLSRG
jgi:hypothetical protein